MVVPSWQEQAECGGRQACLGFFGHQRLKYAFAYSAVMAETHPLWHGLKQPMQRERKSQHVLCESVGIDYRDATEPFRESRHGELIRFHIRASVRADVIAFRMR